MDRSAQLPRASPSDDGAMRSRDKGWTGGQYSVLRVILAWCVVAHGVDVWLIAEAGSPLQRWGALGLLCVLASLLAVGVLDRVAALALALLLMLHRFLEGVPELLTAWPAFESILLLHAFVPGAPYGAWSARGRPAPAGDWYMPARLHDGAWLVVGLSHLLTGVSLVLNEGWLSSASPLEWVLCAVHLGFLPLALIPGGRPWALVLGLSSLASGPVDGDLALALGAHLSCFTPAWFAPRPGPPLSLFYDGECGLCHGAVRFFIAEDRTGAALRYAPLGSEAFEGAVGDDVRAQLPDSVVLVGQSGRVEVRSTAVIRCLDRLGGGWRLLSWALRVVPLALRDATYDLIARARKRVVAAPDGLCPVLPPELRDRFLVQPSSDP